MTHCTHRLSTPVIQLFNDLFFLWVPGTSTKKVITSVTMKINHNGVYKFQWRFLSVTWQKTLTPFPAHFLPLSLLGQLLEGSWSNGVHWLATQICCEFCKDGSFYKVTVSLVICEQVFFIKSLSAFDKLYNDYSKVYGNICLVFSGQDSLFKNFRSVGLQQIAPETIHPSRTNKSKLAENWRKNEVACVEPA